MKIYTKTGDNGETGLFGGPRVTKDHIRIHAYGTVDELSSILGIASVHCTDIELREVIVQLQNQLFVLGADLATPRQAKSTVIQRISTDDITYIEDLIDKFDEELPPLKNFILPGGSLFGATLHYARTVCRRAERFIVSLAQKEDLGMEVGQYINRLSDLLFVMARTANYRSGGKEMIWKTR